LKTVRLSRDAGDMDSGLGPPGRPGMTLARHFHSTFITS